MIIIFVVAVVLCVFFGLCVLFVCFCSFLNIRLSGILHNAVWLLHNSCNENLYRDGSIFTWHQTCSNLNLIVVFFFLQ